MRDISFIERKDDDGKPFELLKAKKRWVHSKKSYRLITVQLGQGETLKRFVSEHEKDGVQLNLSTEYTSKQNKVCETSNQIVVNNTTSMMKEPSGASLFLVAAMELVIFV